MVKRMLILVVLILALLTPAAAASTPAAGGACFWTRTPVPPSTARRLRCECGDNQFSPWHLCMRRRR